MADDKFVWDKHNILWHANTKNIAGWIDYDTNNLFWYARTAGTLDRPTVRAEFDNKEAAQDFLMFIANSENTYD